MTSTAHMTGTAQQPVDLVVRGGTVVEAGWTAPADVLVADGRVVALAAPGTALPAGSRGATEVDASGRLVMPGGVDPHCHIGCTVGEFTTRDDYAACTTAAVFGGTTTVVDFAIPQPGQGPADAAYAQRARATGALCDSALHGGVVDWDPSVPDQLAALVADGITTFKMYTTYRGTSMAAPDTILRTMRALRALGGMAIMHCESDAIIEDRLAHRAHAGGVHAAAMAHTRPALAETASVAEVLALAETAGAEVYVVHQSTAAAVDLVAAARRRGLRAHSETVVHNLVLDDSVYGREHPERYVCCPPMRPAADVERLARRLFTGEVDTVASDHNCFDLAQKEVRRDDVRVMPNGLPGVETRLPVLYSAFVAGRGLPATRFVELVSANPARANGLYPRKGTLLPGADADIVLWDPAAVWTLEASALHMATDYSPFEGTAMTGRPATVIVGGRPVVHEGRLLDPTPRGRHLPARTVAEARG
jgi:dihydropyrimidinase